MGITARTCTFPSTPITYTRVTVTITATFEIRERGDDGEAESAVERAVDALSGSADVEVSYESERVEE